MASVRQNLVPLVDEGKVNPDCATGGQKQWGSTIGQEAYIHRSGFGVTADGAMIYVGGPALSVCSLGRILLAAGVVRGMELDINPDLGEPRLLPPRPERQTEGVPALPGPAGEPTALLQPVQPRLVRLVPAALTALRRLRPAGRPGRGA